MNSTLHHYEMEDNEEDELEIKQKVNTVTYLYFYLLSIYSSLNGCEESIK